MEKLNDKLSVNINGLKPVICNEKHILNNENTVQLTVTGLGFEIANYMNLGRIENTLGKIKVNPISTNIDTMEFIGEQEKIEHLKSLIKSNKALDYKIEINIQLSERQV